MKKIAVVGAGNGGCLTALHYGFHSQYDEDIEVELLYDPNVPSERVGQGTVADVPKLLDAAIGFNWYDNPIHATNKTGILYEGFGKENEKVFHNFFTNNMALHYCPWEMQEVVLQSGWFKVTKRNVDPQDVDADYVFDSRGRPDDFSDYNELVNPTNACILAKPNWNTTEALWSRHVSTPDGWAFVIPTVESSPSRDGSVGYCYNSDITSQEDATKNLLKIFDVEVTKYVKYKNYMAKNPVIDGRIFLQGNRLSFLEPMESTAVEGYLNWCRYTYDYCINNNRSVEDISYGIKKYIMQLQNFILWHYQWGSKYNTPFWKYAQRISTIMDDDEFRSMFMLCDDRIKIMEDRRYGQWGIYNFRNWYQGMTTGKK